MHKSELKILTYPTLTWLKQSFDACGGSGSAAWNSRIRKPFSGWSEAYPETTGYIIETLLDYYHIYGENWMRDYAIAAADWLISIQKADGSFPGGLGTKGLSSVFNSGMILFGLESAFAFSKHQKYLICAQKTIEWLCKGLNHEGKWINAAYVEGYVPSYYTRVIWAVLKCNVHDKNLQTEEQMRYALQFYREKFKDDFAAKDWAFAPGKSAFTHTIAYTMRGFLECAVLLEDKESLEVAEKIASRISEDLRTKGRIAGAYSENWIGDYSFNCVTGNAQLSINFSRLYQITNNIKYRLSAEQLFESVKNAPSKVALPGIKGGIPGSIPFWGKYMPLQYINWGAKFWLDAARFLYRS